VRNILRTIYGPVFDDRVQKWKKKSNKELKNLYTNEDIVQFVDSSILAWAGHTWRADGSLIKILMVNQINRKISGRTSKAKVARRYQ